MDTIFCLCLVFLTFCFLARYRALQKFLRTHENDTVETCEKELNAHIRPLLIIAVCILLVAIAAAVWRFAV